MKKLLTLAALSCVSLQLCAAEQKVGIVNFNSCILESKLGKQEKNALETMQKQFMSLMEDTDKQLREITDKLQDKDYLDGLSKEAEEQMKAKYAQLSEEQGRYQQQYYQFMHQGQNKIMQTVVGGISHASEQIAASKGYSFIINKEACFFYSPNLDVTSEVIREMDKHFEIEEKKQAAAATAPTVEEKKETVAK
jgi:outer membrane protein